MQTINISNRGHCSTAAALTGPFDSLDAALGNKTNHIRQNPAYFLVELDAYFQWKFTKGLTDCRRLVVTGNLNWTFIDDRAVR